MVVRASIRPVLIVLGFIAFAAVATRCGSSSSSGPVTLHANPNRTDGTAVYLLLDVSGSMDDQVPNAQGTQEQKLAIAKRAAIDVCQSVAKYAGEDKTRNIRLAIASFSGETTPILPMGPPDVDAATRAINGLRANGDTAIGDAVVTAQQALDASGLRGQHILILTDGENTSGKTPEAVATAINAMPEPLRPSVYIVAFDVNADVYTGVKAQGWQIFSAANGKELAQRLDEVVGGHILIEQ